MSILMYVKAKIERERERERGFEVILGLDQYDTLSQDIFPVRDSHQAVTTNNSPHCNFVCLVVEAFLQDLTFV